MMFCNESRVRILIIPALVLALAGPAPMANAHSSRGLPPPPTRGLQADLGETYTGGSQYFINFETPHVHPIDISPNGVWLAACNTPDGRVEIYEINQTTGSLIHRNSVPVGVDPVSVRFRTNDELWAVNAISDSISIIDRTIGQVTDTIITYRLADTGSVLEGSPNGDEPMDVVFINSGARAVVSCTRTDILQLYDTTSLALLDEALRLDGEEPREMATDGTNVYVSIFESGNGTTLISGIPSGSTGFPSDDALENPLNPYGGFPSNGEYFHDAAPASGTGWNVEGNAVVPGDLVQAVPRGPIIVRDDGAGGWLDDNGRDWAAFIDGANAADSGRFPGWTLLDNDIAAVTESSDTLSSDGTFGTSGYVTRQMNIVMGIARNPVTGDIFSVGTDATNEIRFEPNITGTFTRVMLSIVQDDGTQVALVDLNEEHLDTAQGGPGLAYSSHSVSQSARDMSIGDPRGIAFTVNGATAYIAGMGSNNIVAVDTSTGQRISEGHTYEVPEGPTGLAHHGTLNRLYVLSKFASRLTVVDTTNPGSETTVQTMNLFDPTPAAIKNGRVHQYGTHENSGLGQIACASCHVDTRFDRLGWNLGNPAGGNPQGREKEVNGEGDGLVIGTEGTNPLSTHNTMFVQAGLSTEAAFGNFSSVKGVMTTQTLQDIIGKEPLHWRGDRDGIEEFAGAFSGLQGRDQDLDSVSMQEYEDFLASVFFEPNPMRPLDNALPGGPPLSDAYAGDHEPLAIPGHLSPGPGIKGGTTFSASGTQLPPGDAFQGFDDYVDTNMDNVFSCVVCHTLPIGSGSTHLVKITALGPPLGFSAQPIPASTAGSAHLAMVELDGTGQRHFKVAGLRNQIEKEGFHLDHGVPSRAGFGVLHDGSIDGTSRFLGEPAFTTNNDQDLADIVAFTLAVRGDDFGRLQALTGAPTGGIPPAAVDQTAHAAVGAQALQGDFEATVLRDIAADDEVDLVVETRVNGQPRRFVFFDNNGTDRYMSDKASEGVITQATLEGLPDGGWSLLYTAVHETTGERIGIDRDEDDLPEGDENDFNSDNTNPNDVAYVGAGMPSFIDSGNTATTVAGGLAAIQRSPGKNGVLQILGGNYNETLTISQPTVIRPIINPATGIPTGSGIVRIGAP